MSLTVTDIFCGGGGSSTGMAQIAGIDIRMAANHNYLAIDVHNRNHPGTDHATVDLHREDPRYFPKTDILWASPECTKWSQANGSKPLPAIEEGLFEDPNSDDTATRSRLLMFDVLRFAEHHQYRVMIIENVVDIATQPKYSMAWFVWRQQLRTLGYEFRVVSVNSMHAQAFGMPAPQSRDRIYIICWRRGDKAPDLDRILRPRAYCAKCDQMVESRQAWKNGKTVGRYRQSYVYVHGACGSIVEPGYLPAAAAIDWSIPGQRIGDRTKPLAEKTRRRIAAGIARYWGPIHIEAQGNQYDAADPKHRNYGDPNAYYRAWPIDEYLRVLHTAETKALAIPVEGRDGKEAFPVTDPMRTQTTRLETALVRPFVAELRGGGSDARTVDEPAATYCASGNHHALVTPYYGASQSAHPVDEPVGTLTTVDRYALIHRMNSGGAEMTTPAAEYLRTLTTAGHQALIQPSGPRGARPRVTVEDMRAAMEMVDDVNLRMFRPLEVAAGMAFPRDYRWDGIDEKGRAATNRALVRLAGNAVTPPNSRDILGVVVETYGGAA